MHWFEDLSDWLIYSSVALLLLSIWNIYLYFLKKDKDLPILGIHFLYRFFEYMDLTKKETGKIGIWFYTFFIAILIGFVGMITSY